MSETLAPLSPYPFIEDKLKQWGVNTGFIHVGDPRHVIANIVERTEASMLVVGSRGLGAMQRAVLGSVSESLVRCCSEMGCAVIVARASNEEKSVK